MINGLPNCSVSTDIDFSLLEMNGRFALFPFSCVRACVRIPHLHFIFGREFAHRHTPAEAPCCYLLFQMMKHAWDSYRQYGWGHNELKPLAKKGHSTNIFGKPNKSLAATVGAHWHGAVNHK